MNASDSGPVPQELKRVESVGGRPADLTVPAALVSRATTDPEGTFLIHGDQAVTFGQMETRAEAWLRPFTVSVSSPGIGCPS